MNIRKKYISPEYKVFIVSPVDIVTFSVGSVEEECEKYYTPDDCEKDIF